MLDRFKKQPSLASTVKIQVVNLREYLKLCKARDQELNQIMLIPTESIEFVRSLQPAPAQNQTDPCHSL